MLRILTLLFSIITMQLIAQTINEFNWTTMRLNGKVKNLKQLDYKVSEQTLATFGEIEPSVLLARESHNFDSLGNITESRQYYQNGSLILKCIYGYSSKGYLLESNAFKGKGKLSYSTIYHYDSTNNVLNEEIIKPSERKSSNTIYSFFENGTKFLDSRSNSKCKTISKISTHFDSSKNQIETDSYVGESVLFKRTYKYNGNNCLAELDIFEENGVGLIVYAFTYSFDEKGNWIKRTTYRVDITSSKSKRNDLPILISTRKIDYY